MDNSLKPIEAFVQEGLQQRFQQIFGFPLVYSNSPDKKATAKRLLGQGLKYPLAFASVSSDGLTKDTYRPHGLWRRGLVGGMAPDRSHALRLNLIPVTTEYEITFLADSLPQVRRFTKLWLLSLVQKGLKFSVTYGVADLWINVEQADIVQVPQRQDGLQEVKQYELVTSLTISGYMSADELKNAQVVTAVEAEGFADPVDVISKLDSTDRASHRAFFFNTADVEATEPENVVPPPAPVFSTRARRTEFIEGDPDITYIGLALSGSLDTDPVWRITRLTVPADGEPTTAVASGVTWTDRATHTYT